MEAFEQATLSCGLRVIYEHKPSAVLYCGYVVCAGTRHEDVADSGMAHFIEHITFKGTERRRACHITNGLERVGGDLNAYTTKQETVYYATVLKKDFAPAAPDGHRSVFLYRFHDRSSKFSHPSAGAYRLMMARATRRPSTAALMMPPAYPAPSPQG